MAGNRMYLVVEACGPGGKQRRLRPENTRSFRARFGLPAGADYLFTASTVLAGSRRALDLFMRADGTIPIRRAFLDGNANFEVGTRIEVSRIKRVSRAEEPDGVSAADRASGPLDVTSTLDAIDFVFERLRRVHETMRKERLGQQECADAAFEPGFYHLHAVGADANDHDVVHVAVPLDSEGLFDPLAHTPVLYRLESDDEEYFGEIERDWEDDDQAPRRHSLLGYSDERELDASTDLLGRPIGSCDSFSLYWAAGDIQDFKLVSLRRA